MTIVTKLQRMKNGQSRTTVPKELIPLKGNDIIWDPQPDGSIIVKIGEIK